MRILLSADPDPSTQQLPGGPAASAVAGDAAGQPGPIHLAPDPRLASLESQLAEARAEIAQTANQVRQREQRIAELEDALHQRKQQIEAIEAESRTPRRPAKSALERFMDGEEV